MGIGRNAYTTIMCQKPVYMRIGCNTHTTKMCQKSVYMGIGRKWSVNKSKKAKKKSSKMSKSGYGQGQTVSKMLKYITGFTDVATLH